MKTRQQFGGSAPVRLHTQATGVAKVVFFLLVCSAGRHWGRAVISCCQTVREKSTRRPSGTNPFLIDEVTGRGGSSNQTFCFFTQIAASRLHFSTTLANYESVQAKNVPAVALFCSRKAVTHGFLEKQASLVSVRDKGHNSGASRCVYIRLPTFAQRIFPNTQKLQEFTYHCKREKFWRR